MFAQESVMDIKKVNHLLEQFEKTKTFKRFFSTLLRFDEDLDCFVATEKWRDKEAELLTAAWSMFAEVSKAQSAPESFEQAYSEIFSPIIKRPYPRLVNGDYKYSEIDQGWKLWRAAKAQAVPEQVLKNHCMVGQTWFMEGTPVSALIRHAESVYKAEVIAQNSKIEFGTDDNEHWFAHDVPFYGTVQIDRIEEHGLVEWDIHFNGCWQGPFGSKSECIKHLEGCIAEEHEEAQEPAND